jgi:hypothetical protein
MNCSPTHQSNFDGLLMTKTYQHTNEHTHDVLRMALFWDTIRQRTESEQEQLQ